MSQQEMEYDEMNRARADSSYGRYEGTHHIGLYGEKLSPPALKASPTAGQRLALAIVSLLMLLILILGLAGIAAASQASTWVIIPILFIYVLFSAVALIINVIFNRRP